MGCGVGCHQLCGLRHQGLSSNPAPPTS
jgi:hypothetical protein